METSAISDDQRAESEALLDELKEQVRRAEVASEQYQRELMALKSRFEEITSEQIKSEDLIAMKNERIEALESGSIEAEKRCQALEATQKEEEAMMNRDREASSAKEEELMTTIQRLRESLSAKEARENIEGGAGLLRTGKIHQLVNNLPKLTVVSELPCKNDISSRSLATRFAGDDPQ